MKHDLRWLLWLAWPCFVLACWSVVKRLRQAWLRRTLVAVCALLVCAALYQMSVRLRPPEAAAAIPPQTATTSGNTTAPAKGEQVKTTNDTTKKENSKPQAVRQDSHTTVKGNNNVSGNNVNGNQNVLGNNNNNAGNNYYGSGVVGWLIPANDPTPDSVCSTTIEGQGGLLVFFGDWAAGATTMPNIVMSVGGQPRMTLDRNDRGELAITTDVFDSNDDVVVEIKKNKYTVSNDAFQVETPDKSTLSVVLKHRKERVLDVRFINKHAIRIMGHFRYPDSPDIVATSHMIQVGNLRIRGSGSCATNPGPGQSDFSF